ncbi:MULTISPECIES: IS110 family transposase [Streptomyces]|uniref:IS110 family transposase n=1 Tax=Streptomyces TaxID=1883 RepID=UPI00202FA5CF|nr:transposase [Streptomyces rhizosphaericus]
MPQPIEVIGGIDTHTDVHQAAVIDTIGQHLATEASPTTPEGYRHLLAWLRSHGQVLMVGMEGTGSFGAELARHPRTNQITVIEVDRPDRRARRATGKSDPVDAYAAATAVLSGGAKGIPKGRDGTVEAIRARRVVRASTVKARTQTTNQIKSLIITAPAAVREALPSLTTTELIRRLSASRPGADLTDPAVAVKLALKRLTKCHQHLSVEIADAVTELRALIASTAPGLLALPGVGTETAGQLLVTAGDNPDRLVSKASFAYLCAARTRAGLLRPHRPPGQPRATHNRAGPHAPRRTNPKLRGTTDPRRAQDEGYLQMPQALHRARGYHHLTGAFRVIPSTFPAT